MSVMLVQSAICLLMEEAVRRGVMSGIEAEEMCLDLLEQNRNQFHLAYGTLAAEAARGSQADWDELQILAAIDQVEYNAEPLSAAQTRILGQLRQAVLHDYGTRN